MKTKLQLFKMKKNHIVPNVIKTDKIYLSMTTKPDRITNPYFKTVIDSLFNQTIWFDKLIINLSVKEFEYKSIPKFLTDCKRIILNETDVVGPCTKLVGSVKSNIIPKDTVVIVLDDDTVMHKIFIQSLYYAYKQRPKQVHSHITNKYKNFSEVIGFSGYIFNINYVQDIVKYYEEMPSICKYVDDTWIGWCFYKMNLTVNSISKDFFFKFVVNMTLTQMYDKCLMNDTDRKSITKKVLEILDH